MTTTYRNLIIDQLQSVGTLIPVRQTILSGEIDSNGYANFLEIGTSLAVDLNATDSPLRLAFAAGFNDYGPLDYLGNITADESSAWSSLTASTTNYLYIDRNISTGELTYGFTTLEPNYGYARPSSPSSGQHHFNISRMVMEVYNGSAWEEKQRLFVGEAVTDGSSVTDVISYALQARYDSGWIPVSNTNNYSPEHKIGISIPDGLSVQFYYSYSGDNSDASYAHDIMTQGANTAGHGCLENTTYNTRNIVQFGFSSKVQYFKGADQASGYYRVMMNRMW